MTTKTTAKVSYKGITTLAGVARIIGMSPKAARGKRRRHSETFPVSALEGYKVTDCHKVATFLKTDFRVAQ